MINNRSGISAYMLLDEYTTVEWQQGINRNEIFHWLIKWGNPNFDQNPKYHGIWLHAVILSELFTFNQMILKEDLKENALGEAMF